MEEGSLCRIGACFLGGGAPIVQAIYLLFNFIIHCYFKASSYVIVSTVPFCPVSVGLFVYCK